MTQPRPISDIMPRVMLWIEELRRHTDERECVMQWPDAATRAAWREAREADAQAEATE